MPLDSIVIVGGGLAAASAAEGARAAGYAGRITLLSEEAHPPYERPPLSKELLLGHQLPEQAFIRQGRIAEELDVELVLGASVISLDADAGTAHATAGEFRGDAFLLATGSRPRLLEVPGGRLQSIFYLRTIRESIALREAMVPGSHTVIVGGGFVGLEVAATAAEIGCAATVVEAGPSVLHASLGDVVGKAIQAEHERHGVRILTNTSVVGFGGSYDVSSAELSTGQHIAADSVVIGIGAGANSALAAEAGLLVENGVVVDSFCRTSYPNVFAAGDVANSPVPLFGDHRARIEHWQNALHQGARAGANMVAEPREFFAVPWFWSKQYGVNLQFAGIRTAQVVELAAPPDQLEGYLAAYLDGDRIVGVVAADRPRTVRRFISAITKQSEISIDDLLSVKY